MYQVVVLAFLRSYEFLEPQVQCAEDVGRGIIHADIEVEARLSAVASEDIGTKGSEEWVVHGRQLP